jgi:Domain of unknown function (DUF222)
MSQPPALGPGPGVSGAPGGESGRAPALADFAAGGTGDACPPGPDLAVAVAGLSGPDWRCPGATDEELLGLLNRWAAVESWAAAGKLGVARELLRRRGTAVPDSWYGDLPEVWDEGTGHELSGALAMSLPGADKLLNLAWTLQARLPRIGALLAAGIIDTLKAGIIVKEFLVLDDEKAAAAEALIAGQLAGKTPGQIGRLAVGAVLEVDREGAEKRREQAEREDARVRLWRENTGASAMAAHGLPTDAALAAHANINARALAYKKATVMPGAKLDQLRVLAFTDILNGITLTERITITQAQAQAGAGAQGSQPTGTGPAGEEDCPDDAGPVDDGNPEDGGMPEDRAGPGKDECAGTGPALPARANLTLPLATLLGLADRPGEGHGLGPLDPALVRGLAATAARSPHSTWCLTITDHNGHAIAHGCARPARGKRRKARRPAAGNRDGPWAFTRDDNDPGPPGGYGSWTLTLPAGQDLTVQLGPIPVHDCDHRHESAGYQPGGALRHLVEIRDGECTFPSCSRHASGCDYEHTIPHDRGGRTCACNGAARSRRCHRVKQSKGWTVTQPRPGWHQWTGPSGRIYTQGPMKYPA